MSRCLNPQTPPEKAFRAPNTYSPGIWMILEAYSLKCVEVTTKLSLETCDMEFSAMSGNRSVFEFILVN